MGSQKVELKLQSYNLLINGKWASAITEKTFTTRNPATGEPLAQISEGDEKDIDLAVNSARKAFDDGPWPRMDGASRGRLLLSIAEKIREQSEELAHQETLNNGKAIRETKAQVSATADYFEYYGGWADKLDGHVVPVKGKFHTFTTYEPIGVCGQIIPWNSPLPQAAQKLAPALAAGCTMVLKPAEQTPITALLLGQILLDLGLPEGVVNIVPGLGNKAGAALASHENVDKIVFTGSVETGKEILRSAGSNLKKVTLELGGKAPNIVCKDADIDRAVNGTLFGIFAGAGQYCDAGPRLFLHTDIRELFVEQILEKTKTIRLGDPLDPSTHVGSLTTAEQLQKVMKYVELGASEGAKLIAGGAQPKIPGHENGNFFEPTIFDDVKVKTKLAQDEIFGPVLSVMDYTDDQQVIEDANGTSFGLVAGVWSRDIRKAMDFAQRIKAGTVWINTFRQTQISAPFGGYKMSGIGREKGLAGLREYCEEKSTWIDLNDDPISYFDD